MIPNYMIYGYGDLANLKDDLWDETVNSLDSWAACHLGVSGWYDRFKIWTWSKSFGEVRKPLPFAQLYLRRNAHAVDFVNNITRYFSPSGFKVWGDKVRIFPE